MASSIAGLQNLDRRTFVGGLVGLSAASLVLPPRPTFLGWRARAELDWRYSGGVFMDGVCVVGMLQCDRETARWMARMRGPNTTFEIHDVTLESTAPSGFYQPGKWWEPCPGGRAREIIAGKWWS